MHKRIVTVTLNPAYDVHCRAENFVPFAENYIGERRTFIGGKGINVSLALASFGVENSAVAVLGEENSREFTSGMKRDFVHFLPIPVQGRIRENLTVHGPGDKETRLSFDSFTANDTVLNEVKDRIAADKNTMVAFCGRLPKGLSHTAVLHFLSEIRATGAFLAIDSNSLTKYDLLAVRPSLIKPNAAELCAFGYSLDEESDVCCAAEELHGGGIENVLVSRSGGSAVYAGKSGVRVITVPRVNVVSTIGAGDSTVAGYLAGICLEKEIDELLSLAFAFGSAACLTEGTTPPEKQQILRLQTQVKIEKR